ncbi:hypothetical protein V6N13_026397 [Hibiscus sabdariffa]
MNDEEVFNWMNVNSFCWALGKGDVILFWYDSWCGDLPLRLQFPKLFRLAVNKMAVVRDFVLAMEAQNGGWAGLFQRSLVDREFKLVEDLKLLLSEYRLSESMEDKLIWIHGVAGSFSVKKLSSLLNSVNLEASEFNFERVWKLKVPPKIRSFVWMLVLDRLPSKEFLLKRGVNIPIDMAGCPWCGLGVENTFHLLIGCRFVTVFWQRICVWWKRHWENSHDIVAFFDACFAATVTG